MSRTLALDVGERRIGVAICDPEERTAVALTILQRRDEPADVAALKALIGKEEAGALVVGLPLSMDGSFGPQAQLVRAFAERLAAELAMPLELWDERLSTQQVERRPVVRERKGARSRRPPRPLPPSDDLAAAVILQSFLDSRRHGHSIIGRD